MSPDLLLRADGLEVGLRPDIGGAVTHMTDLSGEPIELMRRTPPGFSDVLETACFALTPFSNRVRDGRFSFGGRDVQLTPNLPGQKHPLHGQGWRGAWSVADAGEAFAELVFDHAPGEWPWRYQARQRAVLEDRGLTLTLSTQNLSDDPMPCGLGLHPYFPCDGATVLDTTVSGVWTVDDEVMPVERIPAEGRYALAARRICGVDLDNGYDGWSGDALISWPAKGRALRITSKESRFQVYAPPQGGLFAAEPVTHDNGALNLPLEQWEAAGLWRLAPGETGTMSARFQVLDI